MSVKIPELSWPHRDGAYDDELLLEIEAGVITYLIRGRNAWHSTWVRHWFRNTHLFSDIASAKQGAEPLRERGNVFYIHEAPALILRGPHEAVVLCDHHEDNPFSRFIGLDTTPVDTPEGRWIGGIFPGVSLRDAVAAFGWASGNWSGPQKSEHSMLIGVAPSDYVFTQRKGKLQSLTSYPQGSGYLLGWSVSGTPRSFTSSGAAAVARRWHELTALATDHAGPGAALAGSLARYRATVINAEPRSQWLARREAAQARGAAARDALAEAWDESREHREQLESAVWEAEEELEAARAARLRLADTSAGIRAQRERVEAAEGALAGLRSDLAFAEAIERTRRDAYLAARRSMS